MRTYRNLIMASAFLLNQNSAIAAFGTSYDKRCTKQIPYKSSWIEVIAKAPLNGDSGSPSVLPNGNIIVGTTGGSIYIFDKNLKEVRVESGFGKMFSAFGWLDQNTLMIGSEGNLTFYNYKTTKFSRVEGANVEWSTPIGLQDGIAVVGTKRGIGIYKNGALQNIGLGATCNSSPAVMADDTIVLGCENGKLFFLSPTGEVLNVFSAGKTFFSSPLVMPNGEIIIGNTDGYVYFLSPDGKQIATSSKYAGIQSTASLLNDSTVVIGSDEGYVLYLDSRNGKEKARYPKSGTMGPVFASPLVTKGRDGKQIVVVPTLEKNGKEMELVFLTNKGDLIAKMDLPKNGYASPTATADGKIVAGDDSDTLYLLELKSETRYRRTVSSDCSGASQNESAQESDTPAEEPGPSHPSETNNDPKQNDRFD